MSTVHFGIELEQHTLKQIDAWRTEQPGRPTQAEAVQRLVEVGLAVVGKNEVRVSDGEKLIMMMLRDLYKHQKIDGDIDPEFIQDALLGGHYWGLQWQMSGLLHNYADDTQDVSEVVDILEMWDFIESGYAALQEVDKTRVEKESGKSRKNIKFPGFDGNRETEHLGIANFLVNKMERFDIFKGRSLNSHMPSIESYRRMLSVFKPMRKKLGHVDLSPEQFIELMNARKHPENH